MHRVLVPNPIAAPGLALLTDHPAIELDYQPQATEAEIRTALLTAEGLLLRTHVIPDFVYAQAAELRLVSRHGVGVDNVPLPTLEELGIGLAITADANAPSVAEHTVMLILAACRRLVAADILVKDGRWAERAQVQGRDLIGARVTLLGFGRIGQAVVARLLPFGAKLTIYDPGLPDTVAIPAGLFRAPSLESALKDADIVALHAPAAPGDPLIGASELALLAPGAILVNTARGSLVDETALLAALDTGQLDRYATDVFAVEPPPPDAALPHHDHVIATPHNSAITVEGAGRMSLRAAQNLIDGLTGTLAPEMTVLQMKR